MTEPEPEPAPALVSAVVTEHFVLQSLRSTATGEATARASLFLGTLSSAMIAVGFVSGNSSMSHLFLLAVLPVVLLLGLVTFLRLVDLGIQDLRRLQDIERLKDFYRGLGPAAAPYFPPLDWADPRALISSQNMRAGPRQLLSTAAALVAVIDSAVFGIAVVLLLNGLPLPASVPVGIMAAAAALSLALRWQWIRNQAAFSRS